MLEYVYLILMLANGCKDWSNNLLYVYITRYYHLRIITLYYCIMFIMKEFDSTLLLTLWICKYN